ncbi:sensor histidine kinase [Gordonia phthalatica]|uniref:sensor histidine kinase n=1 Tax=Gordonia phthalatica TaxID=1136941 RepID=UPI000785D565|nr:ATP-binding protein [Gordonia phthalatica]
MILGICCLGVFAINPGRLAEFASLTSEWWSWSAVAVIVATSASLVTIGIRRRTDLLGSVGSVAALAYTGVLVLWLAGWNGATAQLPDLNGLDLWVIFIPQILGCVLVMGGRLMQALGTVVVAGGLSLGLTVAASGHGEWREAVQAVWLLALISLYQVITWAVIAGARRYDAERAAVAAEAVRRLHDRSRGSEQRRLDAMVHDRLIAILLALRPGPVSPGGRKAITSVLDEIADWRSEDGPGPTRVSAADLAQRLRLSLDEIDERVEIAIDGDPDADYPADASDAIIDAVGEAVRNFHRHAGVDAACAVLCDVRDGAITVVIVDDGVGFEPRDVPANRIGVALGIVERMHVLAGGDGRVESEPGVGTRVELSWAASAGDR